MRRLFLLLLLPVLLQILGITGWGFLRESQPAAVAIVLGTTVYPSGALSERLHVRLEAGRQLYVAGKVSKILVSGATGVEGVNEAQAMATWLIQQGVPSADVFVDPSGANTRLTAQNAAQMLGKGTPVIAVSSWYHLARTELALRQAGLELRGAQRAALIWEPREIYSLLRESIGFQVYLWGLR
jgi:vancomycin permeability regulator SanA